MTAPLPRPDEMPVLVDEMPVSGRSQPRPLPLPEGFAHDLRFRGVQGGIYVTAYCAPCGWATPLEPGHGLADLIRLAAQHAGVQDQVTILTEALLRLLGHHTGNAVAWPHDEPSGTETTPGSTS